MLLLFVTTVPVVGASLVLIGLIIRLVIGKRRFERRGLGGLQQFSSYWAALFVTLAEWILGIVAAASILAGLFLLLIEYYNRHH